MDVPLVAWMRAMVVPIEAVVGPLVVAGRADGGEDGDRSW